MIEERRTTADGLTIYNIPVGNLPGLLHKLDKLSRKARRIMDQDVVLNIVQEVQTPIVDRNGRPMLDADGKQLVNLSYDVTIDSPVVRIPGWTFLATIDHTPQAGNIIRVVPNIAFDVPERYRSVEPICQHCNKVRSRRDTYLLRCDASGEIMQIGRQCIRDFIGYDPTQIVGMAEVYASAIPGEGDGDEDWSGGMRDRRYIFVLTYLAHVSRMMRAHGWVSRKDCEFDDSRTSTATAAHYNMFPPPKAFRGKREILELTTEDQNTAAAAMAWAQSMTPRSDFDQNMHILAQESMIEGRSMGIVAYIVPAYMRHIQREFQRAERRMALRLEDSQHIGTVTERLRNIEAVVYGYFPVPGFQGQAAYLYLFQTNDGNVLRWKSSTGVEGLGAMAAQARTKVRITGTVKRHDEYKGVKQTDLTRCEVTILDAPGN